MKQKSNPLPHYYICETCAKEKGGIHPGGYTTVHMGECPYCKLPIDQTLHPTIDFNWPKLKKRAVFD